MTSCFKRFGWSFLLCLGVIFSGVPGAFAATSGSHYPFGAEGVLVGSIPPPGFYYRMYNTWYHPTSYRDNHGNDAYTDFDLEVFSSVQRFVTVTDKKILGADYVFDVVVPLVDTKFSVGDIGLSDSQSFTVGDVVIQPLALAWHKPRWDAAFGLAVILPTGEYDADKPASPGLGYWSGMLTLGGTYFLDAQRSWSLSALTRTLIHTEQDETEVTPGPEFVVEYGIGKEFPVTEELLVRPGLAGTAYLQLGDDSEDGPTTVADELKQAYSLGAEINFFLLPKNMQMNLRFLREFGAENTSQGSQVVLTFTKGW